MQTQPQEEGAGRSDRPLPIEETARLIASDKVEGTAVVDRNGVKLGTIRNFMVDKYTGQVAYAVMSFGGFLGIGERYHPLPWRLLDYDAGEDAYVIDIDREQLEHAPHYAADETPWSEPEYGQKVLRHYKIES